LSIVFNLEYYSDYLLGKRFNLFTDNKSVSYLLNLINNKNKRNEWLLRWISVIQRFSFKIYHINGMENILPDKLSRIKLKEIDPIICNVNSIEKLNLVNLVSKIHQLDILKRHLSTITFQKF
jgi:hypothetical protein